ncbi:hypothetical protein Btru_005977 [Bulinus truncatus]|nr:hypothetical protein Btru_005977 [Bulinus truncatus]
MDDQHKANNLIDGDGSKRWLSHPKDRSGKLEIIFQLEKACQFAYIDVGTLWCASLEIRVGCSDWPQTMDFKSLLPPVNLMSSTDCLLNRGTSCTKMFSKADFSKEIAVQKWDRMQLICRQPFKKEVQIGVSFVRIKSFDSKDTDLNIEGITLEKEHEANQIQDVDRIFKHFFGDKDKADVNSVNPVEVLKQRLVKISGSSENGCNSEHALTRTAKIVLKATENSSKSGLVSPHSKRGLYSEHMSKKNDLPFESEVSSFLSTLKISPKDLDRVTIADIRHKFEKKKHRKLSLEEKKIFSEICQNFICDLFEPKMESNQNDTNLSESEAMFRLSGSAEILNCKKEFYKGEESNALGVKCHQLSAFPRPEDNLHSPYRTPANKKSFHFDKGSKESIDSAKRFIDKEKKGIPCEILSKSKRANKVGNAIMTSPGSNQHVTEQVNFDLNISDFMCEAEVEESVNQTPGHHISDVDNNQTFFGKKIAKSNSAVEKSENTSQTSAKSKRMKRKTSEVIQHKKQKQYGNSKGKAKKVKSSELDTALCDKCFVMIPKEDIGMHYVFCIQNSVQPEGSSDNELWLDNTDAYVECPICLERYPQDVLPVHASECGL